MRKFNPGHYTVVARANNDTDEKFVGRVRRFVHPDIITGVKFMVPWKDIETIEGVYDFTSIDAVIKAAEGKQVAIEIRDRTFDASHCKQARSIYPRYIIEQGLNMVAVGGKCMPRAYLPAFMDRWIALWTAIYDKYDTHPQVELMSLWNETALPQPLTGKGFAHTAYLTQLQRLVAAFSDRKTRPLMQINFLGGPQGTLMDKLIASTVAAKCAIGWPDPLLHKYPKGAHAAQIFALKNPGKAVLGPDVDASFLTYNPVTKTGDVPKILDYYVNKMCVNYIFWQPIFSAKTTHPGHPGNNRYFEDYMVPALNAHKTAVSHTLPEGWQ